MSRNRVVAAALRPAVASLWPIQCAAPLVVGTIMFALVGSAELTAPPAMAVTASALASSTTTVPAAPSPREGVQPRLASDPAQVADDLVADELALRDSSTDEAALVAAARREQAAYRAIGRHPDWDAITRPRIPPSLREVYDRNVDARRQLTAMTPAKDTLPGWRIEPPAPADELLSYYHEAESQSGVGW